MADIKTRDAVKGTIKTIVLPPPNRVKNIVLIAKAFPKK